MQDIIISLLQADIAWENKQPNLEKYASFIRATDKPSDIIILPEMFSTGFTMNPASVAEGMNGMTVEWMRQQAVKSGSVITGSVVIEEDGRFYNRLVWMKPDGTFDYYDKKHLFTMVGEQNHYSPGNKKLVVEYKGWKICPMICYDLRFPVWIRNIENYDLLIFVANWPAIRSESWEKLLYARAIENQCYVAGVNRVGYDFSQQYFNGPSMIINPLGKLLTPKTDIETTITAELDYSELINIRSDMPFLADRDGFEFKD
jgi:omega-amidase